MNAVVKCLVWDLDDTLWDGVVLESDAAAPHPEAWRVLRLLDERGIVHAVASRSEPALATAHLDAHGLSEMFCSLQIGWGAKSAAVRQIAEHLNIGLDAIAFVDNDPVERAEVAAALPQVRCYAAEDLARLPELSEFNPAVITPDARDRRKRYRAEQIRRDSAASFEGSDTEFLAGLGLVMTVRRAGEADLGRAHELTVRTNQLNTTGRTFDIDELRELSASPDHEVLIAELRDRFGEYGAIGLAVTEFRGGDAAILLLLMSCRVMSRGVGGALLAHLIDRAAARGQRAVAEFVPTPVNRVMLVTLRFAGFAVLEQDEERVLLGHDGSGAVPNTGHVLLRAPDAPVPPGDLVTGLMRQVARVPDRIALISGDHRLSYRELDSRTAELAGRLVGAGVRPGDVVLCHLRQGPDAVIAMLAALRAGAAWCLLEPDRPAAQIATLLSQIYCTAVIFDPADYSDRGVRRQDEVADREAEVAALFASSPRPLALLPVGEPSMLGPLPAPPSASTPAYVITTSGSTGIPKAVLVSRANLAAMIAGRAYPYTDGELVTLSTCPLTADASLLFAPWAFTVGGTVVVPTHRELPDGAAVAALARRVGVSHLIATPSYYRLLLDALAETPPQVVALAGEQVPSALAVRHHQLLPNTLLLNEYGPTEATVTCVWHTVAADPTPAIIPIGTAMPGNSATVLGPDLRSVPTGETGELYLGGDQIALGYAGRAGLTATRFVADLADPGARMYRTGDLARRNDSGAIEFLGRRDGQVQVRGARVERHAVEAVLENHPGVAHAVTLVLENRDAVAELVAFIVPADLATPPERRALARHCLEQLQPMEVPSRFVRIDTIPIAAAGKLDEAVLRAAADGPALPGPARHGWTDRELEIAELWSVALEHDDFDLADSFFEVGGNSHRVVFLHLQMEQRWPGAIRVGQLFDLRTIGAHAEALETALTAATTPGTDESAKPAAAPTMAFEL
ncbi:amino acid adenylation domain-containing protein [Nocardia sp. XZ_19_385]|uniref:amino acid adenylation domain-containing protein n=1 Tax=Nocardia sp. XZ_19_385 TaxID=2769488 RepID=UPI0018901B80|nr:amino acid adenylation domain-containing protein [Nocardia sp. XZ_19_385]